MKKIFPLSYKVNPEKPMSVVIIGLIYVALFYYIRLMFLLMPVYTLVNNLIGAVLCLYPIVGLVYAIYIYLKK